METFTMFSQLAPASPPVNPSQPQSTQSLSAFRWATVTQADPLRIRLDGDTVALTFTPESLLQVVPAVDQRVWVQLYGRRVIVLGVSEATPTPPLILPAYQSYDPKLNNITLGTGGTKTGWYSEYPMADGGAFVQGGFYLLFGTSPSISATCYVSLPRAAWTPYSGALQLSVGTWIFRDQTNPYHYAGSLGTWESAGTNVSFSGAWDGTAPRSRVTSGVPATVASTDIISASFGYRAAPPA